MTSVVFNATVHPTGVISTDVHIVEILCLILARTGVGGGLVGCHHVGRFKGGQSSSRRTGTIHGQVKWPIVFDGKRQDTVRPIFGDGAELMAGTVGKGVGWFSSTPKDTDGIKLQTGEVIVVVRQIKGHLIRIFLHHTQGILRVGKVNMIAGVVLEWYRSLGHLAGLIRIVCHPRVFIAPGINVTIVFFWEQGIKLIDLGGGARPSGGIGRLVHFDLKGIGQ